MNRSLANVILGGYSITAKEVAEKGEALSHQETDISGAVDAITNARSVIIVPGYGLAVASAQYAIADLVKTLTSRDIKVRSAGSHTLLLTQLCEALMFSYWSAGLQVCWGTVCIRLSMLWLEALQFCSCSMLHPIFCVEAWTLLYQSCSWSTSSRIRLLPLACLSLQQLSSKDLSISTTASYHLHIISLGPPTSFVGVFQPFGLHVHIRFHA